MNSSPICISIYSAIFISSTSYSHSIASRSFCDECKAIFSNALIFLVWSSTLTSPLNKYLRSNLCTIKSGYLLIGDVKCV